MDSDDCVYLYLDFNDRLAPAIFDKDVFMRVANLHKTNPLVQINDLIFIGTYDECVGSNIFFEEVPELPPKTNIFEKETAIHLRPLLTQTKILKMQQMKLPKTFTNSNKDAENSVQVDLTQDYVQVLEKLENGTLSLEDLSSKSSEDNINTNGNTLIPRQPNITTPEILPNNSENRYNPGPKIAQSEPETAVESCISEQAKSASSLEIKYERLRRLAGRPVRRMRSPERIEECEARLNDVYEYHNLECLFLQNSDAFRTVSSAIIEKNLVGAVDLDRCALNGIIASSETENFRNLTPEELNAVLSVDNFENLSLPARYLVLKESLAKMEALIENTSTEELKETDENGRTVETICEIFRKLVAALERQISQNSECVHLKPTTHQMEAANDEVYVKYKQSQAINIECPELLTDTEITYGVVSSEKQQENDLESASENGNKDDVASEEIMDLEDDGDDSDDEDFIME